jgi:hypothetical protein
MLPENTFAFDLFPADAQRTVKDRFRLRSLRGHSLPAVGDLLEVNEFSNVVHEKWVVVQVHRFYGFGEEYSHESARVYVLKADDKGVALPPEQQPWFVPA